MSPLRHRNSFLLVLLTLSALKAQAFSVSLSVEGRAQNALKGVLVRAGVPFPDGALASTEGIRIVRNGVTLPAQFRKLATWPGGSIRWLRADFISDVPAAPGRSEVTLETGVTAPPQTGIIIEDSAETMTVRTGAATFGFNKRELRLGGAPFEVSAGAGTFVAEPASWTVEDPGPIAATLRVEGSWRNQGTGLGNDLVRFRVRVFFQKDSPDLRVSATFRNNNTFCWDPGACTPGPSVTLEGARFGAVLLPSGGPYVFGQGVEKTWDVLFSPGQDPRLLDSRFTAAGEPTPGSASAPPLALASPAYYASTKAWGTMTPAVTGLLASRQADLDHFEKLQRAKVLISEVENPPNLTGLTVFGHLSQDVSSWNDYGDLRWAGNGCGSLSGNHYDWSYGMYLQLMRTGILPFGDAARLFARHEIDFDIYHTSGDGGAFNYQKNWEDRPSHDTPDNCFGGGRPTHTWSQGYGLHWLLTGDPRGRDGFDEIQEGIRQYVYESFSENGHVSTSEIRLHGWLTENLVARYRIEPDATIVTTAWGTKTIPEAIKAVLEDVLTREAAAGGRGFVYDTDPGTEGPDFLHRSPLQHLYFLEPAIEAYTEVFKDRDPAYAERLLGLIERMTGYLMEITYGGDTNSEGFYRPRQIPYVYATTEPIETQMQGQIAYLLQASNAAGFLYTETGERKYLDYARLAFRDYIRYFSIVGGDSWADPGLRSPTSYNSTIYDGTESKIHGWSNRYGQHYLAAELAARPVLFVPVVLDLHGRAGSHYSSEMTLTNLGNSSADMTFEYTDFMGGGSGRSTASQRLEAGRQLAIPDVMSYLRSVGIPVPESGDRGGTLRVWFDGLDEAKEAAIMVRSTTPVPPLAPTPRGKAGLSYAAVLPSELLAAPVYIPGLRQTARDRSAVAVQNAGDSTSGDITLRITLMGEGGAMAAPMEVILGPGGFAQPALPEVAAGSNGYFAFIERVAGTAPFFAYGVVNDNQNSDGSFLLPVPATGSLAPRLILPVVVEAGVYSTEVILTNTSRSSRALELAFASPGGTSLLPLELAPSEQRILPQFVEVLRQSGSPSPGPAGGTYTGPLTISAPSSSLAGILAAARTSNPDPDGAGYYGVAYGAVPSTATASATAMLFGLTQNSLTRTNLALVNTAEGDGSAIELRIEIFDGSSGGVRGETTLSLNPHEFHQIGKVLPQIAPGLSNGFARVSRVSGKSRFITYAVVNDGGEPNERSGDGAFVPMRVK